MNNSHNAEINKRIAEAIKKMRLERGLTQWDIADKLGVSQHAYYRVELGQTRLTVVRLIEIADILACSPAELLRSGGISE